MSFQKFLEHNRLAHIHRGDGDLHFELYRFDLRRVNGV